MDHITVPKHCVCSGRYMFSYLSMQDVKTKAISLGGSLALRRECVIFLFYLFIFLLKKNSASVVLLLFLFLERFQPQCSY